MNVLSFIFCSLFALMSFQGNLSFSGTIITSDGQPVVDATVLLQRDDNKLIRAVGTDDSGAFKVSGLSIGQYKLWVAKDGYDVHSETIPIAKGEKLKGNRFRLLESNLRLADLVAKRDQSNFEIAGIELRREELDKALAFYSSFLEKYPFLVKVHYNAGLCYMEKAEVAKHRNNKAEFLECEQTAQQHFLVVLQRYPDFSIARKALADSYISAQMISDAEQQYELLLKDQPRDPLFWYTFGEINSYLRQFDRAEDAFLKILDIDSSFADAYAKIGAIRMARDDLEGAISNYEIFLRMAPKSDMVDITKDLLEECRSKLEEQKNSPQKENNLP